MKAALNGVPSISVLDGWWIQGHIEGVTGWSIEGARPDENDSPTEARSLYDKLESVILPLYYKEPEAFARVMREAIRDQWIVFQHPANADAVRAQRLRVRSQPRVRSAGLSSPLDSRGLMFVRAAKLSIPGRR